MIGDCMSEYYDVSLKVRRESILPQNAFYKSVHEKVETENVLKQVFQKNNHRLLFI